MNRILAYTFAIGLGIAAAGTAQASPVMPAGPSTIAGVDLELVSGGCGPRGFRDRFGNCRANRRPVYQRCPPGTRPTPAGCRRNY